MLGDRNFPLNTSRGFCQHQLSFLSIYKIARVLTKTIISLFAAARSALLQGQCAGCPQTDEVAAAAVMQCAWVCLAGDDVLRRASAMSTSRCLHTPPPPPPQQQQPHPAAVGIPCPFVIHRDTIAGPGRCRPVGSDIKY